jgi:hypothetical protein
LAHIIGLLFLGFGDDFFAFRAVCLAILADSGVVQRGVERLPLHGRVYQRSIQWEDFFQPKPIATD